jgi:uncharacterized RDD family membrane protein YckC
MVEGSDHDQYEHREITIESLASPPIQVNPAPQVKRFAAAIIDTLIVAGVWLVLAALGRNPLNQVSIDFLSGLYIAVLAFVYYFVLEWIFAATVGKFLLKLWVLGLDGDPCTFSASLKRNLLRFVDWLPALYLLGGIAIAASPKRQRIGDRVASTIVVRVPEKDQNPPPAPFLFH